MRQISKGSPMQQEFKPQAARKNSQKRSPPPSHISEQIIHPNKSQKKSRTTHATASCVFSVVGPLNQSYVGGNDGGGLGGDGGDGGRGGGEGEGEGGGGEGGGCGGEGHRPHAARQFVCM
jgi:hypothetical protein